MSLVYKMTEQESWADVCHTLASFCATAKYVCDDVWPIIVYDLLEVPGRKPNDMSWNKYFGTWCKKLTDPWNGIEYVADEGNVVVSRWMLRHMTCVPDPRRDEDAESGDEDEPDPIWWVSNDSFLGDKEWALALLPLEPRAYAYLEPFLIRDADVAFLSVSIFDDNWKNVPVTLQEDSVFQRRLLDVVFPIHLNGLLSKFSKSTDPQLRKVLELRNEYAANLFTLSWKFGRRNTIYGVSHLSNNPDKKYGYQLGPQGLIDGEHEQINPVLFAVDSKGARLE
jgi:hypothetical protein